MKLSCLLRVALIVCRSLTGIGAKAGAQNKRVSMRCCIGTNVVFGVKLIPNTHDITNPPYRKHGRNLSRYIITYFTTGL